MSHLHKTLEQRFWEKVDKNGPNLIGTPCWLWKGSKSSDGYGYIWFKGKVHRLSKFSYFLGCGELPPNGKKVCHKCDNPPCVRFDHFFIGTHHENILDAVSKGRMSRGKKNKSNGTKQDYYDLYLSGAPHSVIAEKMGVTIRNVRRVLLYAKRKHKSHRQLI